MRKLLLTLSAIFCLLISTIAQNRTVTGRVTDASGQAITGASVIVKGTRIGTTTNSEGNFSLSVPTNAKTLQVSSVDMSTQDIAIRGNSVDVALIASAASNLQEVVVVGYQTIKRSDFTGAAEKVGGKELAQKPIGSFIQNLQGKATGVQITGASGRPGANGFIRIRGAGSINASSEPLIILDGIAINSAAYALINPNDIEEITVLKDAAASSIYGSRAANGVLVITTKRGKKGQPELTYSFQYGRSEALELKNVQLMNSKEKLRYEYEFGFTNPILDSMITNRKASGVLPANATLYNITDAQRQGLWDLEESRGVGNWRDYLLQKGTNKRHEVSLSGASDKVRYFFSLNATDNEGVQYKSYQDKKGGRLNVDIAATDWFRLGTNLGVTVSNENVVRSLFNTQNSYAGVYLNNPYEPLYLADGITYNPTFAGYSPLEGTDHNPSLLTRVVTFSTIYGELNFFKHLTLKSQVGINYNTAKGESYLQPGSNLANILGYSQKNDNGNQDFLYVFTNTANWRQTLGSKHNINILAGQEFTKDRFYSYSLTGRNFPTASVNTLDNSSQPTAATTSRSDWSLISYFANATYDYNKKYFFSVSGRRDGSSRFGANNRFGNFYAFGAAWDITKESIFKLPRAINTLRLKGSYGTAGNFNIGNYDALGVYSLARKYNDLPAATPLRLPNPDLTWEKNVNFDIGLEYGLFKNRIKGTVDYYQRKTNDLLYGVNVSATTGFTSYTGNIGNLKNTGIEVAIDGDIVRNSNLTWNVGVSYSHNDNKLTKLYSDNAPNGSLNRFVVGYPVNNFYMVRSAGVNPANGKNQFYNKDGTISENYSSGQAVLLDGKSPNVKYFGSITSDLTYKGFDLSAQFYYSGGNYIMNYEYQVGASDGENYNNNQFTNAFNYWKKAGDKTEFANLLDPTQNQTFDTDKYLEKGDYLSLRDLTLGYTLSANAAKIVKMKSLRFYVQGTNLFLSTKFRGLPEVGEPNGEATSYIPGNYNLFAYPQIRAITFGVDVKF